MQEAAVRGVIAGYPLVDFRAECFDGSYHDVDSNEMSFKMAGILAFRNVAPKCKAGAARAARRGGRVDPRRRPRRRPGRSECPPRPDPRDRADGRLTKVRAIVPEAELYRYSTTLHSITHGRGTHRSKSHGYAEAPPEVTAKVAAENEREHAAAS